MHVCYVRELHLGDRVTVTFQLLDHDDKRLRAYQEIRHVDGWLAATSESLSLHVDMSGPKVAPFPPDVMARVEAMRAAHAGAAHARARRPLDRHQAQGCLMSAQEMLIRAYDRMMFSGKNRRYYGNSGFYNFGYWATGATSQEEACNALVDRLVDRIPARTGTILDVACGMGASTKR